MAPGAIAPTKRSRSPGRASQCCRELVVHLSEADRRAIDGQDWAGTLDRPAYLRIGWQFVLNKRDDGACVFLDEPTKLCRIHARYGEAAKPLACRMYPFSVFAAPDGWRVSLRFDCPTARKSDGAPLVSHRDSVADLLRQLPRGAEAADGAELPGGIRATRAETKDLLDHFSRWMIDGQHELRSRLEGAAWVAQMLFAARFEKVRGQRLAELLTLLFQNAADESSAAAETAPSPRQCAMLRQIVFAHVEHVGLADLSAAWPRRLARQWRQARMAGVFRRGRGDVPEMPGFEPGVSFEAVEAVAGIEDSTQAEAAGELLTRYVIMRLESGTVYGAGYYGWPIVTGLLALFASMAAMGWLARLYAAAEGRAALSFDDVSRALCRIDRAAGRLPALGTAAERLRLSYLAREEGAVRLIARCRVLE